MADLNEELLTLLNGPGPQHINKSTQKPEFTEGSDGALHTKIVDHNGNPVSSTNKLQVADSDVKTELELIKQQQQEILQNLEETNDRLNSGIDTRLTGSNVEYELVVESDELTISPGSQYVGEPVDFKGNSFGFNLRLSNSAEIEVIVQQLRGAGEIRTMRSAWELLQGTSATFSARKNLRSSRTQFIIRNRSEKDVNVRGLIVTDFI